MRGSSSSSSGGGGGGSSRSSRTIRGSSCIMIIKSSEKQPLTLSVTGLLWLNLDPVKCKIKIRGSGSRSLRSRH